MEARRLRSRRHWGVFNDDDQLVCETDQEHAELFAGATALAIAAEFAYLELIRLNASPAIRIMLERALKACGRR